MPSMCLLTVGIVEDKLVLSTATPNFYLLSFVHCCIQPRVTATLKHALFLFTFSSHDNTKVEDSLQGLFHLGTHVQQVKAEKDESHSYWAQPALPCTTASSLYWINPICTSSQSNNESLPQMTTQSAPKLSSQLQRFLSSCYCFYKSLESEILFIASPE